VAVALGAAGLGLAILFGVILSVAAIVGDLVESLLKRDAQVKDAGAVLPGWAACSTGSIRRCSRFRDVLHDAIHGILRLG